MMLWPLLTGRLGIALGSALAAGALAGMRAGFAQRRERPERGEPLG